MDGTQFDDLLRLFTHSRRTFLGGALAAVSGLWTTSGVVGKKKHKHKKRQPKARPNAFGCLEVNNPCQSEEQCCSGICAGKKGKKRCRAHDTGTCNQAFPGLCSNPPTIALCNGSETCACLRTTADSNFCAQLGDSVCTACQKDADCEAIGLPPGSACLPTAGGICAADCPETGMVCLPPCGAEIPEK